MDLTLNVKTLPRFGKTRVEGCKSLGIVTIYDLLTFYPRAYEDKSSITPIGGLRVNEVVTVSGSVVDFRTSISPRGFHILTIFIEDGTGSLGITWWSRGSNYLVEQIRKGRRLVVTGKTAYAYGGHGQLALGSPKDFRWLEANEPAIPDGILPVYRANSKITLRFMRETMRKLLNELTPEDIFDPLTPEICRACDLIDKLTALSEIHFPASQAKLSAARKRLAFEELYLIQVGLLLIKRQARHEARGICHAVGKEAEESLLKSLPFDLTKDQKKAWKEICADMESPYPMRRLLQGDVGAGKTAVAALALVKAAAGGYQGAMMAPTEILAGQHYDTLSKMLSPLNLRVGLLTGHLKKAAREEILTAMRNHEVDIVVGTHALIQDGADFAALGLVVTDEQHRFGVAQRAKLEQKGRGTPDVLVMTATPIPRTMTLTVYGDLDVSLLKEKPPGRQKIRTFLRDPERRTLIYEFVRKELLAGRQAYVVCPRIAGDESEDETSAKLPSVEDIHAELTEGILSGLPCALIHGRMKQEEKERVMADFYAGKIKALVATTVIEVGINVPNATIMVIEQADNFGLAQLHQLRGRIGRGSLASYCILVSAAKNEISRERLRIMEQTDDGFLLAEEDLKLRGPGQFFGAVQHGLGDLKIADALRDTDILLLARRAATEAVNNPESVNRALPLLNALHSENFARILET